MKINPTVTDHIETKHTSFRVELRFDSNITFIHGDSGVGKSAVFSFLQELSAVDKRIKCLSYLDLQRAYKTSIKRSRGKLFVIDNADLLLDDALRRYIAWDAENQYIIIGRNPTGLMLQAGEIRELQGRTEDGVTTFSLKNTF